MFRSFNHTRHNLFRHRFWFFICIGVLWYFFFTPELDRILLQYSSNTSRTHIQLAGHFSLANPASVIEFFAHFQFFDISYIRELEVRKNFDQCYLPVMTPGTLFSVCFMTIYSV